MRVRTKVIKHGENLLVLIPKHMAAELKLEKGSKVNIVTAKGEIRITPEKSHLRKLIDKWIKPKPEPEPIDEDEAPDVIALFNTQFRPGDTVMIWPTGRHGPPIEAKVVQPGAYNFRGIPVVQTASNGAIALTHVEWDREVK